MNSALQRRLAHRTRMRLKSALLSATIAAGVAFATARPTFAHHSRAMFDMTQNVIYRGVVKEYRWQNPHSDIIVIAGTDATDRSIVEIEASSISLMIDMGWTRTTFKPGDPITVVAHPGRTGTKTALLFYAIGPDGMRLYRAKHRYPSESDTDG